MRARRRSTLRRGAPIRRTPWRAGTRCKSPRRGLRHGSASRRLRRRCTVGLVGSRTLFVTGFWGFLSFSLDAYMLPAAVSFFDFFSVPGLLAADFAAFSGLLLRTSCPVSRVLRAPAGPPCTLETGTATPLSWSCWRHRQRRRSKEGDKMHWGKHGSRNGGAGHSHGRPPHRGSGALEQTAMRKACVRKESGRGVLGCPRRGADAPSRVAFVHCGDLTRRGLSRKPVHGMFVGHSAASRGSGAKRSTSRS